MECYIVYVAIIVDSLIPPYKNKKHAWAKGVIID